MADFDPQDILDAPTAQAQPKQQATATSDFDEADILPQQAAPKPGADFDPEDVAEDPKYTQLKGVMNRSYWAAPKLFSEPTSDDDIETIAKQHGVDPEELKNVSSFMGVPGRTGKHPMREAGQELAGSVARGLGGGLPQFIVKKQQEAPKFREAIDDLIHLTDSRRSFARGLGEAAPMFGISKVANLGFGKAANVAERALPEVVSNAERLKQVPGAIAKGAAGGYVIGSAGGLAKSREGEELEGMEQGGKTGAFLGGGAAVLAEGIGAGKNYYANKALNNTEAKLATEVNKAHEVPIEAGRKEIAARTADSEKILQDTVVGDKTDLAPQEAATVAREQFGSESYEKYQNANTPEGYAIRERIDSEKADYGNMSTREAVDKRLADDAIETRYKELAHDVTGEKPATLEEAQKLVEGYGKGEGGPEQIANKYEDMLAEKQRNQFLNESSAKTFNQPGAIGKALNFPSASGPMFRYIGDKFDLPLEIEHTNANQAVNRMSYFNGRLKGLANQVLDNSNKLKVVDQLSDDTGSKIFQALEPGGDVASLSPQEQQAAKDVQSFFRIGLQEANGLNAEKDVRITPLSIQELQGGKYLPKKTLPANLGMPKIQNLLDKTLQDLGVNSFADIPPEVAAENPAVQQLEDVANFYSKSEGQQSPQEMSNTLKELTQGRGKFNTYDTQAKAALQRSGGEIPDLIRDKNISRLMNSWTNDVSKHMYLRRSVDRMNRMADTIEKAGGKYEASYIRNNIQDMLGVREGTAPEATRWMKTELNRKMDFLIDRVGPNSPVAAPLKMIKGIPLTMDWLSSQLYNNAFFMNIKNATQHGLAAYTSLAPYLSGPYGYEVVTRSLPEAVMNMRSNMTIAAERGYIPSALSRNLEVAFTDSFENSVARGGQKVVNAVNKVGLMPLHLAIDGTRGLSVVVGKTMAADLAARTPRAMAALRNFSPSLRQEIIANLDNPEVSSRLISDNLNSSALMHYNKMSMSAMGRVLGPALTAFTRLPTQLWGEALYDLRANGAVTGAWKTAQRLMGPYAVLWGANKLMHNAMGTTEPSDREKLVVGSKGLESLTPVAHLQHVLPQFMGGEGGIAKPPVIGLGESLMSPLKAKDKEDMMSKIDRAADEAYRVYGPQSGLDRFLLQTVPTVITGHAPEGKTNMEKMQSGINTYRKLAK